MKGRVIKLISNQYTVLLADGQIQKCIAMGKVRLGISPVVGDLVKTENLEDRWVITGVEPRVNHLLRPVIANVDQAIIVMSAREPDFSPLLVDQLIFLISCANIEPIIMVSKTDLVAADDPLFDYIRDCRRSGYTVLETGNDQVDQTAIEAVLRDKLTVLTGQSGVGKSSFLNRLDPSFQLVTQEISRALGRGKHTTRHVELHPLAGGWVADTPGFSKLDFSTITQHQLESSLRDFSAYRGNCRFRDCLHDQEPGCAIKQAVAQQKISGIRYQHYRECLRYIEEGRKDIYD